MSCCGCRSETTSRHEIRFRQVKQLSSFRALTAMSIFAMNACYLQVNHTLLSEATQMALRLRYHKSIISDAVSRDASQRTFWVIYNMEKHDSFQARSASVIADYDIGCPIPDVPESTFGDYNWFLSSIRFSRILSIAYESLFSLTASTKSPHTQLLVAGRVADMLEQWRQSIPKPFQPHQQPLHRSVLADPKTKQVALATHYHYYHLVIAIERVMLFLGSGGAGNCESPKRDASKRKLLNAARTVIELAQFIDVEPCTPIFILGIMPLSALFVLFDFVIHNPHHSSTRSNLTLLDIASGHFSLLEHASGGLLPGGYLSEFAHIAKRYVDDSQKVSAANETRRVDADLDPSGNIQVLQTPLPQLACALETTDIETAPPTVFTAVSEPLNYPIPFNISGSTDMQAMEGVDFWTLFGPSFVDLGQFGQFNQFGE
ncbi:hypothetical protein SEUCBS140593_006159 [Sporothrix eucalyptigena]|uniref:Xylanolytic transcriptional activator regulatory domain-containing protein n=1 Tax=Sporothrix eucalyptigena TaxID=1812306 RepID=A0ABP0C2X3_9PEZI